MQNRNESEIESLIRESILERGLIDKGPFSKLEKQDQECVIKSVVYGSKQRAYKEAFPTGRSSGLYKTIHSQKINDAIQQVDAILSKSVLVGNLSKSLSHLKAIAQFDPQDFLLDDGSIDLKKFLKSEGRFSLKSIRQTMSTTERGESNTFEIKFHDKLKAIENFVKLSSVAHSLGVNTGEAANPLIIDESQGGF